jgi:phosphoribosyl 1,2-cyclic phosphate phosphodiesterase
LILTCYGTAAAEAIPGLFCSCAVCENARVIRGKEIRARHLSTVDGDIQFDIGPDFFHQINCHGLEPRAIKHLIITHRHSDHLALSALEMRRHPFAVEGAEPLQIIGSVQTLDHIKRETDDPQNELHLTYTPAEPYAPLKLDEDTKLIALPARHIWPDGGAMIYLLERKGKKLLYAHDTGLLFPEVVRWLAAQQIDAVSLDCTGVYHNAGSGHMQLSTCDDTVSFLKESGGLKSNAVCVINHFSHNGGATHEQLEQEARQRGWTAAYDGIRIEIS